MVSAKLSYPRLGFLIGLTPWPVLLWIQSQDYFHPPHGAEPLHAIHVHALVAVVVTFALGFCVAWKEKAVLPIWLVFALIHGISLWSYVETHAVAYG